MSSLFTGFFVFTSISMAEINVRHMIRCIDRNFFDDDDFRLTELGNVKSLVHCSGTLLGDPGERYFARQIAVQYFYFIRWYFLARDILLKRF